MRVNREELKQMIDRIPEQDALEVFDFIGYLNMKREKEALEQLDIELLAKDPDLISQIQKSQKDQENGRMYNQEQGLAYLRKKVDEFEHGQSL